MWGFNPDYAFPVGTSEVLSDAPLFFQRPLLRIVVMGGPFWVAIFFVLSGYVCSIKSLRLGRAGEKDEARKVASKSILRRVIRLVVPATIACILSWTCTQ